MTALTFKPELIEKIRQGQKTQTRRPVRGENMRVLYPNGEDGPPAMGVAKNGRLKWGVGLTRAIKPGRTARGVGRVLITNIRHEPVNSISEADAIAEGFKSREEFFAVWVNMYGAVGLESRVWVLDFEYLGDCND